jgi:TonB-linked SusC/RagA family outer membrane protein
MNGRSQLRLCASLLLAQAVVAPALAQAQTATIAGRVTSQVTELAIATARVLVVGQNRSATTDREGRYILRDIPAGSVTVRIVAVGHRAAEATLILPPDEVAAQDFALEAVPISLDEVVITAAGPSPRRQVANAIATIDAASAVERANVSTLGNLIQGRAAGVQVRNATGTTGGATQIRIRGPSTLSLANDPLLYVDGVRVDNRVAADVLFTGGESISRLNDINPESIESIEIIKGPSAATLYGTEAANGVIWITTKRGKVGPPRWNVYVERGLLMNTADFPDNFQAIDAAGNDCKLPFQPLGLCTVDRLLQANPLMDPATSPITTGHRQQYGANVSGGIEQIQYFVSGEWESEDGVYGLPSASEDSLTEVFGELPSYVRRPNSKERWSFRSNIGVPVKGTANLNLSLGLLSGEIRLPSNGVSLAGVLTNGLILGRADSTNGNWGLFRPEEIFFIERRENIDRFTTSVTSNWRPLRWLTARGAFGLDFTSQSDVNFQAAGTGPAFAFPPDIFGQAGGRTSTSTQVQTYTVDLNATAQFRLSERITSSSSVGLQYFRTVGWFLSNTGLGLTPGVQTNRAAVDESVGEAREEAITLGGFVEHTLGLNDRLFLSGALRADDNSTFGGDFDVVLYGKLSAAYVISEEPWFPSGSLLDDLRLRVAWGQSGLQPAFVNALNFFAPTATEVRSFDGIVVVEQGQEALGVTLASAGNPNLKPERSWEIEIGLDANLFGAKAGVEVTYFQRTTSDALVARPLAPSLGQTGSRFENLGEVRTYGIEGAVKVTPLRSPVFSWDLRVSGSAFDNEVVDLGDTPPINLRFLPRHVEGYPLGGFWAPPLESFEDANGDGIIGFDELVVGDSAIFRGHSQPRYEASMANTFDLFGRVRFYALLDYRGGHLTFNETELLRCAFLLGPPPCRGLNDPEAPLEEQARSVAFAAQALGFASTEGEFLEPGWFVKLREVSVTFMAPDRWAAALRLHHLSFTVASRNLFTIADYSGIDPEVNAFPQDAIVVVDNGSQPPVTTWTFRVNLGF